jgi:Rrf2 family iron-sulfur cluster assembly transcriptional regulator
MQLSTRARYAVMAMVELAGHGARAEPVTLTEIAARQQLSQSYLEQLFGALRRAGLVASARGPGGGYWLARPARSVAIADIVAAVDESIQATRCNAQSMGCLRDASGGDRRCRTHDLWDELGRQIHLFLAGISLQDVLDGQVSGRAAPPPGRVVEST